MACHFDTDRKTFTFIWILENFQYCWQKTDEDIHSPTFVVDTIERSKWSLDIYPRGLESGEWISVYLNREDDSKGPASIEIDFELAFLSPDGSVLISDTEYKQTFSKDDVSGFPEFVKRESIFADQSKFLPRGALTIRCKMWKSNRTIIRDGQFIARTSIGVEKNVFIWKIKNFSTFDVGREEVFRLKSTLDDKPIITLNMILRNNGYSNIILIKFVNSNRKFLFSIFKSSIINAQGVYVNCGKEEFLLSSTAQSEVCALSLSKEALMVNNSLYLPNDILSLCCEYAFSSGVVFGGIEATTYGCSNCFIENKVVPEILDADRVEKLDLDIFTDLKTDLHSLLQDNTLCDVKLCTESETFPAHWIILSARSPVFRAMFNSDMKEKEKDKIDIVDLKPDTIRRMLVYIYTDSLDELQWEAASDLYVAAEKYQIISLKDKCSSFVKTNLSLTNACEVLLIADLHQDKKLKSTVQDFILKNDKSIINSSEWKHLMQTNLNLAAETMLLRFKE